MKIWQRARRHLWPLHLREKNQDPATDDNTVSLDTNDDPLTSVKNSLNALLTDPNVPKAVREELSPEYSALKAMAERLEHGHIHIAVFGRVSVGKSSLLNVLLDEKRFFTSALHGATTAPELGAWQATGDGHVYLYDTPGINEIEGEQREWLAHKVAASSDLVLFVADGDLTHTELKALRLLAAEHRPMLLVLNKADLYTQQERQALLKQLATHVEGIIPAENIVTSSASPAPRIYVERDESGQEQEISRRPDSDTNALKERLWAILEREGKTLSAINAGLFAGQLSDEVAKRIIVIKQSLAQQVVSKYCLAKGLAVAFNPVPITDLITAAALDVAMIVQLSRVYGLPLSTREAGELIRVIMAQMVALMGAVWAIHLLSSMLKLGSSGLSTFITASAQGSVAYYATLVIGRSAERYFQQGKSWGEDGPKRAVKVILDSIDRSSILKQARDDISARLSGKKA